MARSVREIQEEIIRYKNTLPELRRLNSRSATAIWRLWVFIMAVAHYAHELYFDLFRDEINETLNKRIQGTAPWYAQKALEFQDGSELQLIAGGTQLGYDPVQPSLRLVTRAAYREERDNNGRLVLKLAKGGVDDLQKLDGVEMLRIDKYFEKIKFAGTNLAISSLDPDIIIPRMTVFHDGILDNETVFENVKKAIEEFIATLPFDGIFYVIKFVDYLQKVDHITDVQIASITIRSFIDVLNPVEEVVERKKVLDSGYLKPSSQAGETLMDVIKIEIER
jgi:hypothetical protein